MGKDSAAEESEDPETSDFRLPTALMGPAKAADM